MIKQMLKDWGKSKSVFSGGVYFTQKVTLDNPQKLESRPSKWFCANCNARHAKRATRCEACGSTSMFKMAYEETAKGTATRTTVTQRIICPAFMDEIDKAKKKLTTKEQHVMELTYLNDMPQHVIAHDLSIDERQVRQILKEVQQYIKGWLKL